MTIDPEQPGSADRAPPGSRRLSLLHTLRLLKDPGSAHARMVKAYGDPFWVQTVVGPMVVTGHPEGIRAIFSADPDTFEYFAPEMEAPLVGDTSLLFAAGESHRRDRKIVAPAFHGARMRAYGGIMARAAAQEVLRWEPGRSFDIHRAAQTVSLDVLVRALFGAEEPERVKTISEATVAMAEALTPVILFFPGLRREFGGLGAYARFRRASDRLDAIIFEEIAARRGARDEREDILSMLMSARYDDGGAMSDKKLRDEIRVLLIAGHETTAVALAWAFYWIHHDPSVRERLVAEIDALGARPEPDAIAALPYLDAVCQETLRIAPPLPEIARMLRRPLRMMGFMIPAGVAVLAAVSLLHEREDLYPEPERFRPTRFFERKFTPFELAPFGGGAHRCLGASFAMYEMKIVIATVLRLCVLRFAGRSPIRAVRRGVTMAPRGGVPMMLVETRVA